MKARFKHIHKAGVLGFEVEPYSDIDIAELPFSLDDMRYLCGHFRYLWLSLCLALLKRRMHMSITYIVYLDTRKARIFFSAKHIRRLKQRARSNKA